MPRYGRPRRSRPFSGAGSYHREPQRTQSPDEVETDIRESIVSTIDNCKEEQIRFYQHYVSGALVNLSSLNDTDLTDLLVAEYRLVIYMELKRDLEDAPLQAVLSRRVESLQEALLRERYPNESMISNIQKSCRRVAQSTSYEDLRDKLEQLKKAYSGLA
jgi:hypothetical protein